MKTCKICFEEIKMEGFSSFFIKNPTICSKCYQDFNPKFIHFKAEGIESLALYEYDETIKKLLFQFKGCFDKELGSVFLDRFLIELRIKYHGYVIVPIPSYHSDDEERGFNHVEEIFSYIGLKEEKILTKKYKVKQSALSKKERENIKDVMCYKNKISLKGKKILIVDDVYTTGSSFKACLALVKELHPKSIKACFLSKNEHK